MVGKKGFFYFVELIVFILLVTLIWSQFPVVQQSYLDLEAQESLRQTAYNTLKSLDEADMLCTNINNSIITNSNFSKMRFAVKHSLPSTTDYKIVYMLNSTECYSQDGASVHCGFNATTDADVASAHYTCPELGIPVTIKLYLWRIFGGGHSK